MSNLLIISKLCVAMIETVLFVFVKLRMRSITKEELFLSKLPVGSSARRRIGFLISALAIAILCCSPPDNKPGLINFLFVKPSFDKRVRDFFLRHQKILHLK